MNTRILCVDDEPNILEAFERQLRKRFDLETAVGGEQGLRAVHERGPFAVVVSDLRMPGIDGIRFLAKVRESSPDSIRIMLTGQADLSAAIAAVNEGNIFRFLTKPCPLVVLAKSLEAALEQYRLITAERELLDNTLNASIQVLTEVLGLVNPTSFSRANRIRAYVVHMARTLGLDGLREFETAAMLSQLGWIAVPPDILDKVAARQSLSDEEQEVLAGHPAVAQCLLQAIPRLETIAQIVQLQRTVELPDDDGNSESGAARVTLGARLVRTALDFDELVGSGLERAAALACMQDRGAAYDPAMLTALDSVELEKPEYELRMVGVTGLSADMILEDDVRAANGILLVGKGEEMTPVLMERVRSYARTLGVIEPIRVLAPPRR